MSFDFSYTFGNAIGAGMYSILNTVPFLLSIVGYILSSLGFYALAKRRGINHAWLSWIPVANIWILGSLSDQYSYVVKGQVKSRRKLLLTLKIISSGLGAIALCFGIGSIVQIFFSIFHGMDEYLMLDALFAFLLRLGGLALLALPLSITLAVFRYMALYDIYKSCDPENAVMFLVFSIIFSFTEPFFIFFNREKEKGMPPRRPANQVPPEAWQNSQPQQSWEPEQKNPQPQTVSQEAENKAADEQAPENL